MAKNAADERERDHAHHQHWLPIGAECNREQEVHTEQSHDAERSQLLHELGLAFRFADGST